MSAGSSTSVNNAFNTNSATTSANSDNYLTPQQIQAQKNAKLALDLQKSADCKNTASLIYVVQNI